MYKKVCTFCRGESYSSYHGHWICPYCGADLSAVKPQPAGRINNNLEVCPEPNTISHGHGKALNTRPGNPVGNSTKVNGSHHKSARIYYLQPKKT